MRALVIANSDDVDSGFVGQRLLHHGFSLEVYHREHPTDWPDLVGFDLVLLLGSEWSVYWPQVAPQIAHECALVKQTHTIGIPLFGICFGMQIVAHALGGSVARATLPEVGWYTVESSLPQVIASGPWLQWHFDAVRSPTTFTQLAHNECGPQAILAERTFATQFHPEATESMLQRWTQGAGIAELGHLHLTPAQIMADTRVNVSQSQIHCDRLVDWFLESVASS